MRLFLKLFGLHQRVPPSFFSTFCNTMDVKKIPKGPPFYIFRHCDTVQKSHFKNFLGNFFKSPKGCTSIFFSYFATSWSFTKPEGSPLLQFSAIDIAPTLAVLGLFAFPARVILTNSGFENYGHGGCRKLKLSM